jgi:hypothetical protein
MVLKRNSEGKVKVDAFSIFLSLRIIFLSYNLARNHFMYVEEEKFYTRSPTCKKNIRFKRVRVRWDIAPEVDKSTHRQSGNQVTTPMISPCHFVTILSLTPNYKMKCDLRRGE